MEQLNHHSIKDQSNEDLVPFELERLIVSDDDEVSDEEEEEEDSNYRIIPNNR